MAKLDAMNALKIQKDQVDGILQAGRKEDAQTFLDTWRLNNLGTKDSGALPPVDAVPPHLRGWIFRKADASPQDGMKIANFLTPSGSGRTISEEAYWDGYDTIMNTTIDGSDEQIKRLNILWHQFNDQVSNPQSELMISHHTGGKHFTEPSMEELIDGLINGDVPRGTLGDEETENRLIEERQNQLQQQSLMIKNNVANLPYQDGRAPTRLFYNAPYAKPDVFIKDKQIIEDAKKRFKWNTGINLARR